MKIETRKENIRMKETKNNNKEKKKLTYFNKFMIR